MKTRKLSVLFPAMLAMGLMLALCNSAVLAADIRVSPETISNLRLSTDTNPTIQVSQNTIIDSKTITIKSKDGGQICLKQNLETKCFDKINCETGKPNEEKMIPVEELFERIGVRYIEAPESTCNSFTIDVPGNTRYYCRLGRCYRY